MSRSTVQRAICMPSRFSWPRLCRHHRPEGWPARPAEFAVSKCRPAGCVRDADWGSFPRQHSANSPTGNLQDLADRLDPMGIPELVNECPQDLSRRWSSAWAKNALASFSISLARRSYLTSRSRALSVPFFVRDTVPQAGVDLVALDPFAQGLWHTADLRCNGFNGRPQGRVLTTVFLHQVHRAFADFSGILGVSSYSSWLHRLKERSLLNTRRDSHRFKTLA